MALPQNSTPIYTLTIPSSGKTIKYRPFLVKEEKSLLLAQQSDNSSVMVDTLKDIISSCIKDKIDVDDLAVFDLEYIFAQLRAVSIGEKVPLIFRCTECKKDESKITINVDLRELKVEIPEGHQKKIHLFDDVGVVMKYPSIEIIRMLDESDDTDVDTLFNVVLSCIDSIYDTDQIYPAHEQTREELYIFLSNLTSEQFKKIQQFFETMPKMKKELTYNCPACGAEQHRVLEGLTSFF